LERGKINGKKQSLLAKICDSPMFHLGTTGNDDENDIYYRLMFSPAAV
jgi:hypothetical protein